MKIPRRNTHCSLDCCSFESFMFDFSSVKKSHPSHCAAYCLVHLTQTKGHLGRSLREKKAHPKEYLCSSEKPVGMSMTFSPLMIDVGQHSSLLVVPPWAHGHGLRLSCLHILVLNSVPDFSQGRTVMGKCESNKPLPPQTGFGRCVIERYKAN